MNKGKSGINMNGARRANASALRAIVHSRTELEEARERIRQLEREQYAMRARVDRMAEMLAMTRRYKTNIVEQAEVTGVRMSWGAWQNLEGAVASVIALERERDM
ncbi:hypothetical protein QCE49_29090 [Caballeronia sp. LZ008]|nr:MULTISPECIES: hypothetical protein [unclassified Caballeronia]MDR5797459.1 hypothetical protein [Caballeronia sp. LZ008]